MNQVAQKRTKKKLKKDNILIVILTLVLIGLLVWLASMTLDIFKKDEPDTKEKEIVDKVDTHGYYLTDHNTKYYKELYEQLKDVLKGDPIDDEEYATLVAKMFTADFYDLNSKLSKTDVGGIQFILPAFQDTFIKTATDSKGMYYYVQSNLYDERKQNLPAVSEVEVTSIKKLAYNYQQLNDDNAYQASVRITYEKELGYPKNVNLKLAHYDNKIYVIEVS